jgi:hypothetical protein
LALGEEDKVVSKRLGTDAILELALSHLNFVIDFNEFLSKTKNLSFPIGQKKEGKLTLMGCEDDPGNRGASSPCQCMEHSHHNR